MIHMPTSRPAVNAMLLLMILVCHTCLPGCGGSKPAKKPNRGSSDPPAVEPPVAQADSDTSVQSAAAQGPHAGLEFTSTPQPADTAQGVKRPAAAETPALSENVDPGGPGDGSPSLAESLATLEVPPAWLDAVQTSYDTSQPWKEARLEIRRLLSFGQPEAHREALKLTWIYLQKNDIGDGHEYPMYTFLGGELVWSVRAHQEFIKQPHEHTPIHSYLTLASLYTQYGEFEKAETCPFGAVKEDFSTRTSDCTFCQTCGGVCSVGAISFVSRWHGENLKASGDPTASVHPLSRRAFVAASLAGAGYAAFCRLERTGPDRGVPPLRPPGSVPEREFLNLCIRCGECIKVCPGPVLHAAGMEFGLDALWSPVVRPEYAGCHQDCNFCTQVCPTGAIQPLDVSAKRKARIGVAKINTQACLPWRGQNRQDCDLCYRECSQAGYHAIELRWVPIELSPPPPEGMFSELELEEMSRIQAPMVDVDTCVGCGICEYRCHKKYVVQEGTLSTSAIVVLAHNQPPRREWA
jgi:NAD-dependent dihydropyrimidine dehydrogenase PreA subunit